MRVLSGPEKQERGNRFAELNVLLTVDLVS